MCVVLGGQGSLLGVVVGTLCVIAIPEMFRAADSWRLLAFGIALVMLMLWRPMGLIRDRFKIEAPAARPPKVPGSPEKVSTRRSRSTAC
jgi:branched-chain amino acid transport system permease protein